MAFRIDARGAVRSVTETPQGGLRILAAVRRTGILEYPRADGSIRRELVTAEELSRADSLATLRGAPVTNRHPPGAVTRKNFRTYAVGHVDADGSLEESHLLTALVVQADDALSDVETAKAREVSAGYTCDLDETPGTYEGQHYDAIQRNVRYNHVAIVPRGRAGSSVCLRLDSAGDTVASVEPDTAPETSEETPIMTAQEIAQLQADLAATRARADKAEKDLEAEKAEKAKAEGKAEAEKGRADAAEKALKERTDADELAEVSAVAARVLGKAFKADGKTAAQIKAEVVAARNPNLKLDGKDAAFIQGAFEVASAAPAARDDAADLRTKVRNPAPEVREDARPLSAAEKRAKMIADGDSRWKRDAK